MKKTVKISGIILLSAFIIIGFWVTKQPKMLDFRGMVHVINLDEQGNTTFEIKLFDEPHAVTYTVIADSKTKYLLYDVKEKATVNDISIGDMIEGDFRNFSKENHAKWIRILKQSY